MSTLLGALLLSGALLAGCGAACNHQNVCAVSGDTSSGNTNGNVQVCDGNSFRGCNDGDRGVTIPCPNRDESAVCTPNGWAFEASGQAADGGAGDAGR